MRSVFFIFIALLLVTAVPLSAADGRRISFWHFDPAMSAEAMAEHVETLAQTGVNTVIFGGGDHHYMFNQVVGKRLDAYLEAANKAVELCHEKGIKVIEHHSNVLISPDNCAGYEHMLLQGVNEDGGTGVWDIYQARSFCPNSIEFRELYWGILKNMLARVPFDGIMSDDACFYGGCSCETCQKLWSDAYGSTLSEGYAASKEVGSAGWRRWNLTRKRWMTDFHDFLHEHITAEFPGLAIYVLANDSTSPWPSQVSGLYPELYAEHGDMIVWEIYNPADFYSYRRLAGAAAVYRELCELDFTEATSYTLLPYADTANSRDVFDRSEELFMWAFAMTTKSDFTFARVFLTGVTEQDKPDDFFNFEAKHLVDRSDWGKTSADIGLFFSADSRDIDPQWEAVHVQSYHAWAQVLMDNGLPFRAVTQASLSAPLGVKLLILPDVFAISEEDRQLIDSFVESGGKVLIAGKYAWHKPDGTPYDPESQLNSASTLEFFEQGVMPEAVKKGQGKYLIMASIPRTLYQGEVGEGGVYVPPRDGELSTYLANMIEKESTQQITIRGGKLPLFTVYRNDGRITIPMLDTLGLPEKESAVPTPSKVIWAENGTRIGIEFGEPIKRATVMSYPSGEVMELEIGDGVIELDAPSPFQVVTLELE